MTYHIGQQHCDLNCDYMTIHQTTWSKDMRICWQIIFASLNLWLNSNQITALNDEKCLNHDQLYHKAITHNLQSSLFAWLLPSDTKDGNIQFLRNKISKLQCFISSLSISSFKVTRVNHSSPAPQRLHYNKTRHWPWNSHVSLSSDAIDVPCRLPRTRHYRQ